ncbi:MAG: hypothetical protein M9914_01075 [Trueperaceae bacterium]|nr:hypothetical protein [Trueperaceae bacterium]
MTTSVYQAAVMELESVLSPRIVSRALKDGLRQLGRAPETADLADIERVMKAQVFRQLQVMMPVTQAKETVAGILERLTGTSAATPGDASASESSLEAVGQRLAAVQAELRPFNLYFEWPEVQKLRAQVQLVDGEYGAGRSALAVLQEAEEQLVVVKQKLEDQLVLQARDLGELAETLEAVRELGGPRVRRFETLVNQVQAAQAQRQLAPAELERAHRQARELRRAAEAEAAQLGGAVHGAGTTAADATPTPEVEAPDGVAEQGADRHARPGAAPTGASAAGRTEPERSGPEPDAAALADTPAPRTFDVVPPSVRDAEFEDRMRLLDIAAERHDLRAMEGEFGAVIEYYPELGKRLAELRGELEAERSVAGELTGFRQDLEATGAALRTDLKEEFTELRSAIDGLRPEVDTTELGQAVRVTLGILESGLPSYTDVEHVRRLHQLASEQAEVMDREDEAREQSLEAQAQLLVRLEATLTNRQDDEGVREHVERLRSEIDQLRLAQEQSAVAHDLVSAAREAEEALERSLAERATEASERRLARLNALRAKLERLPVTATLGDRAAALRSEVTRLIDEQESAAAVAGLLLDERKAAAPLEDSDIESLGTEIEALREELSGSLRGRLMRLAEEATELGNHPLMEHIQKALLGLELDRYPDLAQLHAALRYEREAQRQEQVDELKRLSQAASPFENSGAGAELKDLLAEARRDLEAGEAPHTLKRAAERLAELERAAEQTLAGMPARLDAALVALEPVAKLNSDGVTTVRRILSHLDSQREALPRLSRGLQLQLDSALSQAERMLVDLKDEYEATRLVADRVVSGGLLDDVLGLLKVTGSRPATEPAFERGQVLADYVDDERLTSATWLASDGSVLAHEGRDDEQSPAAGMVRLARAAAAELPGIDALQAHDGDEVLLLVLLANGERILLRTFDADHAGALVRRVRRDARGWPLAGSSEP